MILCRPRQSVLPEDVLPAFDVVHCNRGPSPWSKPLETHKAQPAPAESDHIDHRARRFIGLDARLHIPAGNSGKAAFRFRAPWSRDLHRLYVKVVVTGDQLRCLPGIGCRAGANACLARRAIFFAGCGVEDLKTFRATRKVPRRIVPGLRTVLAPHGQTAVRLQQIFVLSKFSGHPVYTCKVRAEVSRSNPTGMPSPVPEVIYLVDDEDKTPYIGQIS